MAKDAGVVKEYIFTVGNLTADAGGLLDVYSASTVNGTIRSIAVGSNNFTNTGSIAVYVSGTDNVVQNDLILKIRAGSMMKTYYPYVTRVDNQGVIGSFTNLILEDFIVSNSPIRVVGSALGAGTSGLFLTVRYI